jgi:tRNA modification GTPase
MTQERDTIVAIATAMGQAALGVVRISGAGAIAAAAPLVAGPRPLGDLPSHRLRRVVLVDPRTGDPLDDALCAVMRAPHSYTGEDVVELSCHGSPALLQLVTRLVVNCGARLAEPGEFTRRGFLNGRMDLAEAEAVALLIGARTERAVTLAARALNGGLSRVLCDVRDRLLDLIAGLEVTLDFPDDAVGLDDGEAAKALTGLGDTVRRLLAAATAGRVVHEGLTIAIVGPPNAGKSSLFNMLLRRERAIVSPLPGTTRDVVEAMLSVDGVPVRLLDTAGIDVPRGPIEAEGMVRSRQAIEESDVLLVVFDGSRPPDPAVLEETEGRCRLLVIAKSDLPRHPRFADHAGAVSLSARTGDGMERLTERLAAEIARRVAVDGDEGGIVASLRQVARLAALEEQLADTQRILGHQPLEVAIVPLRQALASVCSLLGVDVGDAVLDRVFASFCLGK